MTGRIVNVGIIGCGEVAQVTHIPTLGYLSDYFKITYLCDVSQDSLDFCKKRCNAFSPSVQTTKNPTELIQSADVDVVYVLLSDEYHCEVAVEVLNNNKYVFIEKPMTLTETQADRIIAAEQNSKGKAMIGYMRRYAPVFELAMKEVGGLEKIQFVRVRDIIGKNAYFVNQSATFPRKFSDFDGSDRNIKHESVTLEAFEKDMGIPDSPSYLKNALWFLGGLNSHDVSLMREAIGMPKACIGAKINLPYINALLDYGHFVCSFETGINDIPEFNAHIEIYSATKCIRVNYDTPYVKGLPITMEVRENANDGLKTTILRPTFEDPYTVETKLLYKWITQGEEVKTTASDAKNDLKIFQMIIRADNKYVQSDV